MAGPRKGYENTIRPQAEVRYPNKGSIKDALHKMDFLLALMNNPTLTLGSTEGPIDFGKDKERLSEEVAYTHAIYRDIDAMWHAMQIPGAFVFDDFDEKGFQQYLSLIQYVFRGEPGIPINAPDIPRSFFTCIPAGKLRLMLFFKPHSGQLYK